MLWQVRKQMLRRERPPVRDRLYSHFIICRIICRWYFGFSQHRVRVVIGMINNVLNVISRDTRQDGRCGSPTAALGWACCGSSTARAI
eukprot:951239-Prorocentrum_lima.AAC.1